MSDRVVHGLTERGDEIVRYARAGKWYIEPQSILSKRRHVGLMSAVREATKREPSRMSTFRAAHYSTPASERFEGSLTVDSDIESADDEMQTVPLLAADIAMLERAMKGGAQEFSYDDLYASDLRPCGCDPDGERCPEHR